MLVSGETVEDLEGTFVTRKLGAYLVKGKDEALQISELIDFGRPGDDDPRIELIKKFAEALSEFQRTNWLQASQQFERLLQDFEEDVPTRIYLELSRRYDQRKPDNYWNGFALKLPLPEDLL